MYHTASDSAHRDPQRTPAVLAHLEHLKWEYPPGGWFNNIITYHMDPSVGTKHE
jgi:hypothetical protein